MKDIYHFKQGNTPLVISIPHAGTAVPKEIACNMTAQALQLPDVDWHLPMLYDIAQANGASIISAKYARYVIDLNRQPEDTSLYPGQDTTGLCPIDTFSKEPIYLQGKKPDQREIQARIAQFWRPYHNKLKSELSKIREHHGIALLWDAHSIASHVPRFFNGKLPDLNFGTADIHSCDASLQQTIADTIQKSDHAKEYSHVFNGRFKGGYITRHYGMPTINIHAIQLELSQCIYMQEQAPYQYNPALAHNVKLLLIELLESCISWANQNKKSKS
ncbi:MAG: N-formylglutamate deformylase [Methylotenera sp.]|nr:N-formylglutamate deformylase [Methylotenera sp.]